MGVELTFWLLATFDAELAREQYEGLVRMGLEDELQARAVRRFASDEDVPWSMFVGDPLSTEALDLRALTFTPSALPAYEASRLVTNLLLAVRREGAPDLTIRLCSSTHPAGVAITLGASAVAYTDTGVTASASDPDRDEDLQGWLDDHFYDTGDPIADPEQTFVIKVQPETVGTDWHRLDDDGAAATTLSGPLVAPTSGTATYDDGAAWTHTSLRVKAAHEGGTILLKVRVSGTDSYALEIGPSQVRLLKSGTLLGEVASLAYPTSDWLDVELRCWTDPSGTVQLRARIDGLEVLSEEDASAILTDGTVGLSQASGSGSRFDDVEVRRLTRTGTDAEVLLTEPFTTSLPSTWTFTGTWTISSTGHNRLDLSKLLALSLQVDYRFQMVAP